MHYWLPDPGGRQITLQIINNSADAGSDGGHKESLHTGARPLGNLGRTSGVTGADGCFRTTYTPPHIAGKFKLKATISGIQNETDIYIYVSNLVQLEPGENYRLNGGIIDCNVPDSSCTPTPGRQAHPSNHWVTPEARIGLINVANAYKAQFYGNGPIAPADMVTYNDASLEWGGKFDLGRKWANTGAHSEHREGLSIDTRSSNLHGRDAQFIQIFLANNFGFNDERTGDLAFHLRYGDLVTGIPGILQRDRSNAFAYDNTGTTRQPLSLWSEKQFLTDGLHSRSLSLGFRNCLMPKLRDKMYFYRK